MADILKVTQPLNPGVDNNTLNNNPIVTGDTKIKNIIDPEKVVRPDGKTEKEDSRFAFHTDSNFESFVKQLRDAPRLYELLGKMMFMDYKTMISSGLGEGFAEEMAKFMAMLNMDEGELLDFMKRQTADSTKFSSVFFQALKEVFDGTVSVGLKSDILDFAKRYNDMVSSTHLLKMIMTQAGLMEPYMMKKDAQTLMEILSRLSQFNGSQAKVGTEYLNLLGANIRENGNILTQELIPFFAGYIEKTHDMGKVRELMTLITHNVSRYLNGNLDGVLAGIGKLLGYSEFAQKFKGIGTENMELIISNLLIHSEEAPPAPWTQALADVIRSGLNNYENKGMFVNIMNSLLLNESVYMPLIHLMIPVTLNENTMFSEVWVDPDAEGKKNGEEKSKKNIRMMVKFDLKNVGFFDVILDYHDGDVDLQVYYPERLAFAEREIRTAISGIIRDNGLSSGSLVLERGRKPKELSEVFPKLLLGTNSVNVRV